jgi:ribosome-associated protein
MLRTVNPVRDAWLPTTRVEGSGCRIGQKPDRKRETGCMITKFRIENDYIELIKLLKVTGLCSSGGVAKIVTSEGRVTVNGLVELRKRCKIKKGQTVEFEGNIIEVE